MRVVIYARVSSDSQDVDLSISAQLLYARRQQLSEPTFGILKEQLGARRFLLRGLANVRAEFTLIATAFNLRTLSRAWNRVKNAAQSVSECQHQTIAQNVFELFLNPVAILTW